MAKKKQKVVAPFLGRKKITGRQRRKVKVSADMVTEACGVVGQREKQTNSASSKKLGFFQDIEALMSQGNDKTKFEHSDDDCFLLVQRSSLVILEFMITEDTTTIARKTDNNRTTIRP